MRLIASSRLLGTNQPLMDVEVYILVRLTRLTFNLTAHDQLLSVAA